MLNLVSTYRIQLHKDLSLDQLKRITGYLKKLGIGTIYLSPVFESVPGSMHGYDGVDANKIDPEIGTIEQLKQIGNELRSENIGWLQDIVPNHMGFHQNNKWLMDVLEYGKDSKYASFFDIDWSEKLMLPFLGSTIEEAIANGELKITIEKNKAYVQYYESKYPLRTKQKITKELHGDALKEILDEQHYRLCSWKETDTKINYRRFFTINGLICLNIQNEDAFKAWHKLIAQLTEEETFTGLRVDHIDGLYDPTTYLEQLRSLVGADVHITVEKILQPREALPSDWKAQGTTGYDFLAVVNNLFTQTSSSQKFTDFYQQFINDYTPVEQYVQDKKSYILYHHMQGELDNLYRLFKGSNIVNSRSFASLRQDDLKEAIAEFLINCPVYRFYGNRFPLNEEETTSVKKVFDKIRSQNPDILQAINVLEQAIIHNPHQADEERNDRAVNFYKRCMQFTGPLMAKGVEDTLMYTWNRFIAHNEVGDRPSSFGISIEEFHQAMNERQQHWPYTLNATATHDTKRGEDARARLNVLSDIPERWFESVNEWHELNGGSKSNVDDNDEYFIYQTLVAVHPFPGEEDIAFKDRINEYLQKAFREAKTHSNWTEPNEAYESAVKEFIDELLEKDGAFDKSLRSFQQAIVDHGIINSLSQLILKFTAPGIPDVYQGCEGWDLSLVDPDNRKPVNYELRTKWLDEVADLNAEKFDSLWRERYSGKIKLWLSHQLFKLRKQQPELFSQGEYIALQTTGTYKENVIAFARRYRQHIYIIALPLHTALICAKQDCDPLAIDWKDTKIRLPHDVDAEWDDIFTEAEEKYKGEVQLKDAFSNTPFLVWKGKLAVKERSAGVLLHLTSLPSKFGIGDMGIEARSFAEFLYRSKQKYWQMLPLSPTEAGQGHSPYSAVSAMAGNTLLISPDELLKEGLLTDAELSNHIFPSEAQVNFNEVNHSKEELLNKAFWTYIKQDDRTAFVSFCENESYWLDDFVLFTLLKQLNAGKPWFQWKDEYKLRDEVALKTLTDDHPDDIYRIKWLQYIFDKQWKSLKAYCNERNISLIGDMPIYVSYDSADVWSNKEIFAIDEHGNLAGMAGVPPDAFSCDGQLWGMPVFNWEVLKEKNYDWWISRIKRNISLFNIIRLDHFRAFAAYWEVPSGATTAKNGEWKQGPGNDLFKAIQNELGELPFIAEDLGDVDELVFSLRDEFKFPGMKVLQFAFGNDLPLSVHIPHNHTQNFVVYTGTHDNNTTKGWYRSADDAAKRSLEEYVGKPVNEDEVSYLLTKMAYSSVANIAIIPMQDLLDLDEHARMNTPASTENNWSWRLLPGKASSEIEDKLRYLVHLYNR